MFAPNDFSTQNQEKPQENHKVTLRHIFQYGIEEMQLKGNIDEWITKFIKSSEVEYQMVNGMFDDFFEKLNENFAALFPKAIKEYGSIDGRSRLHFMSYGILAIFEEAFCIDGNYVDSFLQSAVKFIILVDYYFGGYDIRRVNLDNLIKEVNIKLNHLRYLYSFYTSIKYRQNGNIIKSDDIDGFERIAG